MESIRTSGRATTIFGLLLPPQTIPELCRHANQCALAFHMSPHQSVQGVTVIQDPSDPLGERKIGWFAAVPPPAPGWAPSFPLDVEVDLSSVPANSTLQVSLGVCVCECMLLERVHFARFSLHFTSWIGISAAGNKVCS